jgi:hypothetical protein
MHGLDDDEHDGLLGLELKGGRWGQGEGQDELELAEERPFFELFGSVRLVLATIDQRVVLLRRAGE